MAEDGWRDARVRHAEQALEAAVRTADEIIADATRATADRRDRPEPADPPADEPSPSPILRDAW